MFNLTFLTPFAGLVALVVLVPLVALYAVSDQARRVRSALGLQEPRDRRPAIIAAMVVMAALVGLAAAQPVLAQTKRRPVRSDAEVLVVIDTSRSMLASAAPGGQTRFDRAKDEAVRLRAQLPGVPVGVASMTDRTLPHLFPSSDDRLFRATVEQAVGIERPPPIAYLRTGVTTLAALTAVVTRGFFASTAKHRVLVVFTDGETRRFDVAGLGTVLRRSPGVRPVFVHVWGPNELVYADGVPEPDYRADPGSEAKLARAAAAAGGASFGEDRLTSAADSVRDFLETGPTVAEPRSASELSLARFLLVAAALPLVFVLVRLAR
jgi:hypothetical protein